MRMEAACAAKIRRATSTIDCVNAWYAASDPMIPAATVWPKPPSSLLMGCS